MKVTVDPIRPIPGILPKNKFIAEKMELDLNKSEIFRCMQFGTVYDEEGNVINNEYLNKMDFTLKPKKKPYVKPEMKVVPFKDAIDMGIDPKDLYANVKYKKEEPLPEIKPEEPVDITESLVELAPASDNVAYGSVTPSVAYLESLSCVKEDEYIILETQFTSDAEVNGNLYGLFSITSGSRPTMEYKAEDKWVKFNNKFSNFSTISNGDKFIFRLLPKNNSTLKFKLSIKEDNNVLFKLEGEINPSNL